MSIRGKALTAVGVAFAALLGAWAVWNYTQNVQVIDCISPPPLLIVLSDEWPEDSFGIYEQTTIAWAPPILILEEATASVVTRYWGTPPGNLGVQYEGGGWLGSTAPDCAPGSDGVVGTTGYGIAPPPEREVHPDDSPEERAAVGAVPYHRTAPLLRLENGGFTGSLSGSEIRVLEDAFGPSQIVPVSTRTRVSAAISVWWPVALVLVTGLLLLFVVMRFRRSRLISGNNV